MSLPYRCSITIIITLTVFLGSTLVYAEEQKTPPTYHIGAALPLSGDLAEYGTAVKNGIALAKINFPAEFKHLKFSYDDNRYDGKTSLTILRQFKSKGIDLVYSWGEVPFNTIAPIAEKLGMPLTAYSLDNKAARNSNFIILTSNDPKTLIAPLVRAMRKKGYKHYGTIAMEDPYINSCIDGLRQNLNSDETLEIISTVLPGDPDMKPHALKVKSAHFDAVGVYLYPGQISSLYRSMGVLGLSLPTFGTDIFESKREISASGKAMEGALYPNFQMPEWFSKQYMSRFKDDAQISYAYNGYAWAAITATVLSQSEKKLTPAEMIKAFRSITGGVQGVNFQVRKTNDGIYFYEFPIIVRQIKNGTFTTLQD